jgi:hypothetical protein
MDTIHLLITTSPGRVPGIVTMITQDEEEVTDTFRVVDQTEIRGVDNVNIDHGMTGLITGNQKIILKRGIDMILGRCTKVDHQVTSVRTPCQNKIKTCLSKGIKSHYQINVAQQ